MNLYLIKKTRWPFGCLLFLFLSCNTTPPFKKLVFTSKDSAIKKNIEDRAFVTISKVRNIIRDGDLVTRTGSDFTSESLRTLNRRDKTYSHCGIASIENDTVFIYHALGGEFNPDQKILRQSLEDFSEPYNNRGIGVFRFTVGSLMLKNILYSVTQYYKKGTRFDMDFDLLTDDRMYCAELAAKSFTIGSNHRIVIQHSFINKFEFIGVDDLFLHPLSKRIFAVVYK